MNIQQLFQFPETYSGREGGLPHLIVARHSSGASLALRLTLNLFAVVDSTWVSILASFCARNRDHQPLDLATCAKIFSAFDFNMFERECLAEGVLPLVAMPCSPGEVRTVYESMRCNIVRNLATDLEWRIERSGLSLAISRSLLKKLIAFRLNDQFPAVPVTSNDIPSFLFSFNRADLRHNQKERERMMVTSQATQELLDQHIAKIETFNSLRRK